MIRSFSCKPKLDATSTYHCCGYDEHEGDKYLLGELKNASYEEMMGELIYIYI